MAIGAYFSDLPFCGCSGQAVYFLVGTFNFIEYILEVRKNILSY